MEAFPDGTRVQVVEAHEALTTNWIPEGKEGKVISSMRISFGTSTVKIYYNIKWDDGTGERAIEHRKLKKI